MKARALKWFRAYDLLILAFITFVVGLLLLPTRDQSAGIMILKLMVATIWNCVFHQTC